MRGAARCVLSVVWVCSSPCLDPATLACGGRRRNILTCLMLVRRANPMILPAAVFLTTLAVLASGCSNIELEYSARRLGEAPGVVHTRVWCDDDIGATSDLCGAVQMNDGVELLFFGVGYRSFGETADRVLLAEVGGLSPYVASCGQIGAFDSEGRPTASEGVSGVADFHRSGRFGNHLEPRLTDVLDAVRRHHDLQGVLEKWPQCPDYWSFRESNVSVRYCARDRKHREQHPPVDPACAR